jgi:hypothetical protein
MRRIVMTSVLGFAIAACGGSDGSMFDGQNGDIGGNSGVPENGLPEIGPSGTGSACVSEVAAAELTPTNLVFVYDKSGSMGDMANGGFDPALKWIPVGTGMKEFFADPYSKTLRASLQFFPLNDVDIPSACNFNYATPTVALTSAADSAFAQAIDRTQPSGGTPTLPALKGGIAYAQQIAAQRPADKTAVVLVTDGEPGFWDAQAQAFVPGCPDNTAAAAALAAKAAFEATPSVSTYVIGVGPKLDALNQVAAAGGTGKAIMVDVSQPATTKTTIVSSLGQIRQRAVSCDFSVPPPPPGETLDTNAVNVVLVNPDGSERVLGYSKDCADGAGWHYDNPGAPTRILLCTNACDSAKQSLEGKVSIAFGCKTKIAVR